jgi:hypothetical protein
VVAELLPQRLLGLGLAEVGQRRARALPLRLWTRRGAVWGGRAACDNEASTPCVGCRDITQPSSLITSTPAVGSRAGAGQFAHWPHLGGGVIIRNIHCSCPTTAGGDGRRRNRRRGGCWCRDHCRGRCLLLRLHGHGHTARWLARRRCALCRPRRPRRAPPCGHGRARP